MEIPPFEQQGSDSVRKITLHESVVDTHGSLPSSVPGVEMSGTMLAMVHGDDNPKEPTDLRHGEMLPRTLTHSNMRGGRRITDPADLAGIGNPEYLMTRQTKLRP